ncbi:hypothetical protein G7054_g5834 [Neopestalotiopsis clavispora]|nr:hypothetical protein G7054_g5834 [Neopestalotiopsis clavispora]
MSHLVSSLARISRGRSISNCRELNRGKSSTSIIEVWTRVLQIVQALQRGDTLLITKMIRETSRTASERGLADSAEANMVLLGGTSILHLAVQCAEVEVVEYVLSHRSEHIDINIPDKNGQTPLRMAVLQGRTAVVDLLSQYEAVDSDIGEKPTSPSRQYFKYRKSRSSIH